RSGRVFTVATVRLAQASKEQRPSDGADNLERAACAVLIVLAGACAALWAAGEVAGRASSGRWPAVTPGAAPGIAVRLAAVWPEARRAWPAEVQAQLPGTPGLSAALIAVLAIFAAASFAAWRVVDRRRGEPGWASGRDLRRLVPHRRDDTGLVMGTAARRPGATESRHSVLVLGPTQTGKTTGLAVPAILEWDGPVVATSVKADLLADTLAWRASRGETWVYDPTEATSFTPSTWSPLGACRTWHGARKTASELAEAAKVATGKGVDSADFWFSSAAKLLAPYLFAAAVRGVGMADVVRWVDGQDKVDARSTIAACGQADALLAHDATWRRDDRTRTSIFTTAEVILAAYGDPRVQASSATCAIRAERLLDGGRHTLYLAAPPAEQRRLRPLLATLVSQVIAEAYAKVAATGRPLDPPLLLVLDEAANIAPVADLATIASTAASHGIQLVTVWQDLAQIKARYGSEATTVVNNHRAKVVLAGVGDVDTLDYVARLGGDQDVEQLSVTTDI